MNYFLPTWNPKQWAWNTLEQDIEELNRTGQFKDRWSCAHSTLPKKGDRVFLMRLGQEGQKGICASGYASSSYYKDRHWSGQESKFTNYIDIDFDVILHPEKDEILTLDVLKTIRPEKGQQWTPRFSGISIDRQVAETLEAIWFNFVNEAKKFNRSFVAGDTDFSGSIEEYTEGASYVTTVTKYERNPYARQKCLEYFGYKCSICAFDFDETYGDIGQGFIHVHHITPIHEIGREYQLNPVDDLRPVCPNCHAMLHRKHPALAPEKLKQRLAQRRKN